MSIQPTDLLDLAERLETGAECDRRASISRSYYAAYHLCLDWHQALPEPGSVAGKAGGKHQELINQLQNPGPGIPQELKKLSRKLAIKLQTLRDRRVLADYKLRDALADNEAVTQLQQSRDMMNLMQPGAQV